ncbi:hypothetical protein GQ600_7278 [Phytophthora cactorum]|nr:hypothetical protein GQ600_7278 [Phytophthora cactorum]
MRRELSSVDQFLRDNGFNISDPALGLASLSGDELLDDELLSDADERAPPESPRFVLLDDEDLLLAQDRIRSSAQQEEQQDDSLDRSMLFGGDQGTLSPPPSVASSSSMLELQHIETPGASPFASVYQMTPQQKEEEVESAAMVSAASSTSLAPSLVHSGSSTSSGRVMDDELNDALGVPRSSIGGGRLSMSSRRSREEAEQRKSTGSGSDRRSQQPKTQRTLFTEKKGDAGSSSEGTGRDERVARSLRSSDDMASRWSGSRSASEGDLSLFHEAEEKKEENDGNNGRNIAAGSGRSSEREEAAEGGEGAWDGLNDLLRRNGLPAVRFRRVGSGEVLPDKESLFNVIHDFGVQLEHKNETIQDLVLASKRNSRVQSRREGELQTIERKNEDTQKALEKAKAEIQRLKALQKKESESAELLSKKLKNSCLRLQQQLKVSEHRDAGQAAAAVDKENMSKTRDRRAFRNLQDRDPRRANPRDIQALETIGVYEAQREQMQEEIEHLKSQWQHSAASFSSAALKSEPPVWEQYLDEDRSSGSQYRPRHWPGSSVASDEMMLEQLEAARREQEVAAAKLRHREAAMIKKVAMIEQELLTARETIAELKEENANLTLERSAENKLALEEASDLNELRKYMGTKELTTLEVVKHVCRVLHLTDITLIAPSLDKLCSVVAAVRAWRNSSVTCVGASYVAAVDGRATETARVGGFKASLVTELCKRTVEPRILDDKEDNNREESPPSHPTTLSRAIHIVSELVELEKSVITSCEIYTQAAAEVR